MSEHIYWRQDVQIGDKPLGYTAWYQNERGKRGPVAWGATKEQAMEAVYQELLTQEGRAPSALPEPEQQNPYRQG